MEWMHLESRISEESNEGSQVAQERASYLQGVWTTQILGAKEGKK